MVARTGAVRVVEEEDRFKTLIGQRNMQQSK